MQEGYLPRESRLSSCSFPVLSGALLQQTLSPSTEGLQLGFTTGAREASSLIREAAGSPLGPEESVCSVRAGS